MRKIIPICDDWICNGKPVTLPHSLSATPSTYFRNSDVWVLGRYEKTIIFQEKIPKGSRVIIRFEGIGSHATVFCNYEKIGESIGAYGPSDFDVTGFASQPSMTITLEVSAEEDPSIPPYGKKMDYLCFGGIYREAKLIILPSEHIRQFSAFGTSDGTVHFESQLTAPGPSKVLVIDPQGRKVAECNGDCPTLRIESPQLWEIWNARLYTAVLEYGEDSVSVRFGFKDAEFRTDGFYLNGQKVKILGINRHQSYLKVGYAMPDNIQVLDADLIRKSGMNMVRTSHYMQSTAFIDRCDELGIMVFEEIPGWQHISSDPVWRERTVENVRTMIQRDKSHPSIVLWGVRINESMDDDKLYAQTNTLAHSLDPFRQTGGVRYLCNSHLLEDVYTFNDFIHNGSNKGLRTPNEVHRNKAPHLVTEYCGHMFSTKVFDDEDHRLKHALMHAKVVNDMYCDPSISGCLAWCLFDYNTHDNFGSGDMICHHGICDADRIPKLAWYLYASQNSQQPVLAPSSFMDEGDFPANCPSKIAIFTNADSVKVFLNDEPMGEFFPSKDIFPSLPHPPVIIESFIKERLKKLGISRNSDQVRIINIINAVKKDQSPKTYLKHVVFIARMAMKARMKPDEFISTLSEIQDLAPMQKGIWKFQGFSNSQMVSEQILDPSRKIVLKTEISQTDFRLKEGEGFQVCRIQLMAIREGFSMRLPYLFESFKLQVEGSMERYGTPELVTMVGGGAAIYLRTRHQGPAKAVLSSERFGVTEIEFNVTVE